MNISRRATSAELSARAQTARWISDIVTMKVLEEQRVCVKFCCKFGKHFTQTFQLLNQAYREDSMSGTQCYEWFKHLKEGRVSVDEDPRSGRPSTSTNDDHGERVRAVIRGNLLLIVREVADEVGITIRSCHKIFTQELKMRCDSAKFVPRLLTDSLF